MNRAVWSIIASVGCATTATGQDSVSTDPLGPGDAISAYDTARQFTRFVVDLAPFTSSRGITYGIAPVLKASARITPASGPIRNAPIGAHAISPDIVSATLAVGPYDAWNTPGNGVGPANTPGVPVSLPANPLHSFAIGMTDLGDGASNIVAALVTVDPSNRNRLCVDRTVAITSAPDAMTDSNSELTIGAIDAALNLAVRADGFEAIGPAPLQGHGVLRVNADLRSPGFVNDLSALGPSDTSASEFLLDPADPFGTNPTGDLLLAPNAIPESAGGHAMFGPGTAPQILAADYSAATSAHLTPDPAFVGLPDDATWQLGTLGFAPITPFGSVGTAATILADASDHPVYLGLIGLDATAAPTTTAVFAAPATLDDPAEPYGTTGAPFGGFTHTNAALAFNGSSGAVTLSTDANGQVLAAAVFAVACDGCESPSGLGLPVLPGTAPDDARHSGIAVLRFDPTDPVATQSWTLAAWTNGETGMGKSFADDQGTPIGMLLTSDATPGTTGPSISGVSMDSAGNLLFSAPYVDFGPDTLLGTLDDRESIGLFRAVYDATTFSYTLDRLISASDIIPSQNTGLNYRIDLIAMNDDGQTAPGAFFGTSATHAPFPGSTPADAADPDTLGAAVVSAIITYDANEDGTFDLAPGTLDETYATLLVVTPLEQVPPITDCNGNEIDDATDISSGFSQDFNADGVPDECQLTRFCADVNQDGLVSMPDFTAWVAAYNSASYLADQNFSFSITPSDFVAWVANYNLGPAGPLCVE